MIIRQECEKDYNEICSMVKAAFETAEHTDGNEYDLVNALRDSEDFVPELSLVAENEGKIVGHIMFTTAKVGEVVVLVLAPLSIALEFQKQGIGTALMKSAHEIAKEMGFEYSFVLGSEKYYPRLGYVPAEVFGVDVPEGIPSENFMALKLTEDAPALSGTLKYAKEFGM